MKLLSSFDGDKRNEIIEQHGFFTAGFKTVFGVREGVVRIQACTEKGREFTTSEIWLKVQTDPETKEKNLSLISHSQTSSTEPTQTFTKTELYIPVETDLPLNEAMEFDHAFLNCTKLLNKDIQITKDGQIVQNNPPKPYSETTWEIDKYNLQIRNYAQNPELTPMVYIDNLPVMPIAEFIRKFGVDSGSWDSGQLSILNRLLQSSISFSFESRGKQKTHPLNITRSDFADSEVAQKLFEAFLAQNLSLMAYQLLDGELYPHLPDEGLQKRYAFDINSVPKEVDFFTTGMNKIIKCYDLKKVNNLEIPTDFRPIDLLRLIEYEIPGNVSTHNGAYCYMNFLDIRETYQYIIEEVPDYNRTSFQNAFLQWIKTTEYGKNTRFTGYSNQRVRDFMRNETSRNYEIINPTPEEKSKLEFFENAVEQILDKIVENLGVNITQTFAYTKSDNPVTANWIIDEIDNQIKINWLWDKDGVLDFLNNPKEMMDAYIHELTHVFEGLSRKNYTGSESNSNRETHDNRFLASLRLLAINCT